MGKILIDKGADIHSHDNYKRTPAHFAAQNNNVEVLKLLIEKGADIHSPDNYKMTPAHYAA